MAQCISKGAVIGISDKKSKDGGMTNFEWDIPVDKDHNIVLYAHTFACSLKPTKLANQDPLLQAETKIDVLEKPKEQVILEQQTDDPYSWLDSDDPRWKMTDEEILRHKVPLNNSVLSAAEKESLIHLMLENTEAFSM